MADPQTDPALVAAENYEKSVVTYTTGPITAILLEYAKPLPGEQVADIACGTGIVARQTAPYVGANGAVAAVDINPAMLAVARSLPVNGGGVIDWREGNAQALPLPDNTFDLVLCQHGLQFVPDRLAALREMIRVLKPGGRAVISVWRSIEHQPLATLIWGTIARHLDTPVSILTPQLSLGRAEELNNLLESAGFTGVTINFRSYTTREPHIPKYIEHYLPSITLLVPAIAAMTVEERTTLAQAIQDEIAPGFNKFVVGDEVLNPLSMQIALGYKP